MLTRQTILNAGLELIDEVGVERVTMRALATRLDVTATAIYHYFAGRDELLEGVVDMVCEGVVADVPDEGPWQDRIRILLTRMVDQVAAHPKAIAWAVVTYPRRRPVLRIHEAILRILHEDGVDSAAALHIKGAVLRYLMGHVILLDTPPGVRWRQLPKMFEHYRAAGPALDRFDNVEQFEIGLGSLLAGLPITLGLAPLELRSSV